MNLPEHFSLVTVADGRRMPGLMVVVTIKTLRKNDFHCAFGPSDSSAVIMVTRAELIQEAQKARKLLLMDYGDPEKDFAGTLEVSVMNVQDLISAIRAARLYGTGYAYPPGYLEALEKSRDLLHELKPSRLSAQLVEEVSPVRVLTIDS